MPKSRRNSRKRHNKQHKLTKRGGMNTTDTLDALEQGKKYGDSSVPFTYNPNEINISQPKMEEKVSAVDFFAKASDGMAEQAKLEQKYKEAADLAKQREEMIEKVRAAAKNTVSAETVFSGLRPELQMEVDDYTKGEMEPFTYGQGTGGRNTRRYKRKGRKGRNGRKGMKGRNTRRYRK